MENSEKCLSLRSFLDFCIYYRKFVTNFSLIVKSLYYLIENKI